MGIQKSAKWRWSFQKQSKVACKDYSQEESIDYGETFSPIARLEGVRTLLAYDKKQSI